MRPLPRRRSSRGDALASAAPQSVRIRVDRGYVPIHTRAFADEPLRVLFDRVDDDQCTERVVFSSPHIETRLAANGMTTVDLPPQPAGTIRFTCGMGRYRGQIELVERDVGGRRRPARAAAIPAALGVLVLLMLGALGARAFVAAAIVATACVLLLLSLAHLETRRRA